MHRTTCFNPLTSPTGQHSIYRVSTSETCMKTTAQKWGNSLAIRVPKSVAQQVGLKEQDDLEIEVQDGNVILKPHVRRVYRLEDLVKQITRKNVHGEIETGTSVGREIW